MQSHHPSNRSQNKNVKKALLFFLLLLLLIPYQNCGKGFQTLNMSSLGMLDDSAASSNPDGTKLVWNTHPLAGTEDLSGFKIYVRVNQQSNIQMAAQLNDSTATSIDVKDLQVSLNKDDANYLYITTYNAGDESDPSPLICWGRGCK